MFLDLAEDQSRSDGMSRAGGDKNRISGMYRNVLEAIFRGAVRYGAAEFFQVDTGLESHHDFRTFASPHRVPHFRLAAASGSLLVPRSIIIIRMNLHGKLIFDE